MFDVMVESILQQKIYVGQLIGHFLCQECERL